MHLLCLNTPDLLIPLWRGLFTCEKTDNKATWDWAVLQGDTWKQHGQAVADATPYLPGSFGRPPRNLAEKINSRYKAWEFMLYLYGLGPRLLYNVLPEKYWRNYCKLVFGVQLMLQNSIKAEELMESHTALAKFAQEFEEEYYQRRTDRLHFVRPSIHGIGHLPMEVQRIGPGAYSSQWVMERTIGNLGEEIKQHSNPYANISQRGLRRCQTNALKAMMPDLSPPENVLPRGAVDLGDSYILLRAMDNCARPMRLCEAKALQKHLNENVGDTSPARPTSWCPKVVRWARAHLPNGQIARTL
jgi:hypothetical protein